MKRQFKMEDIQRLCVKRWSCKASVIKLLVKVEEATFCELSTVNSKLISESYRLAFTTTLTQLKTKKDLIKQMDNGISEATIDEEELETELTDANSYLSELEEKIAIVTEFVRKASQLPLTLE